MSSVLANFKSSLVEKNMTDHLREFDEAIAKEGIVLGHLQTDLDNISHSTHTESIPDDPYDESNPNSYHAREQRVAEKLHMIHARRSKLEKQRVSAIQRNTSVAAGKIHEYFNDVQKELGGRVKSRQLELNHQYGDTVLRPPSGTVLDPENVDWDSLNQRVQIDILAIRGVRNKVPPGKYVLLVSKLTQLGGWNMPWARQSLGKLAGCPCQLHDADRTPYRIRSDCEICCGKVASTYPVDFLATKDDHTMVINSKLFTFMPAQKDIKPYQTLLFELVMLPEEGDGGLTESRESVSSGGSAKSGHNTAVRRPTTVAWGCFPTVNPTFNIVKGMFRVPLLRGSYKDDVRHYVTVQKYVERDIENWLANLYFEVSPSPRTYFGRDEFHLQTKTYNQILKLDEQDEAKWGEDVNEDANSRWQIVRRKLLSKCEQIKQQQQLEKLDRNELDIDWQQYTGNVSGKKKEHVVNWFVQVQYCWRAVLDELMVRDPRSHKFWLVIVVLVMSLYAQLFLHGMGMYTALSLLGVPILTSEPQWYGFLVSYRSYFTSAFEEIFVVVFAQGMNLFVTSMLIGSSVLFKFVTGTFPEQISKFVFCSTIAMLIVPFVQMIISASLNLGYDDLSRLMNYCDFHKYAVFIGIGAFLVIYLNLCAIVLVFTYLYTMRVHLNGTLQDCYWRIHVARDGDSLFIPNDFELSIVELSWIMDKAEGWRGANGNRRKVMVEALKTTDVHDPKYEKKELRVAIYEVECGNSASEHRLWWQHKTCRLYREFYVLENGSIVEAVRTDGQMNENSVSSSWAVAKWREKMLGGLNLMKKYPFR
eukprot:PhF_6_TR23314/c0_g1_i1/m.32945